MKLIRKPPSSSSKVLMVLTPKKGKEVMVWTPPPKELMVITSKPKQVMVVKPKSKALVALEKSRQQALEQQRKFEEMERTAKAIEKRRAQAEMRREMEELAKELRERDQRRVEVEESGPVVLGTMPFGEKTLQIVELTPVTFGGYFIKGERQGRVIGPGTDLILVDKGARGYCATTLDGNRYYLLERSATGTEAVRAGRSLAGRSLAAQGFWILIEGFGSFRDEGTMTGRQAARSQALSEAKAILTTLGDVEPGLWLKGEHEKLLKAATAGDLKAVQDALKRIDDLVVATKDKWHRRARADAAAVSAAQALLALNELAPMPEFAGVEGGEALLKEFYKNYDEAKASIDRSKKTAFAKWLTANVMPKITDPRTIYQIFGMVLPYIDLPVGTKVTAYPLGVACEFTLTAKVVQRTRLRDYAEFLRKGLPPYASTVVQIWEGTDSQGREVIISGFCGTQSLKAQDKHATAMEQATGSTANADPSGIGHQGFLNQRGAYADVLLKLDPKKKKLHLITGHSLGGATSFDGFACAISLGFNAHYVGFNAPGTNHETLGLLSTRLSPLSLALRVTVISDKKDWIPTAGEATPFGRIILNSTNYWGRSGLLPIRADDLFLGHGSINLIIRDLVGGGYSESVRHAAECTIPLVEYFRPKTAYAIFTRNSGERRYGPAVFEAARKRLGWSVEQQVVDDLDLPEDPDKDDKDDL